MSRSGRPPLRDRPGLQPERTHLAWERSCLGFLASGALVLLRHTGPVTAPRALLAGAAGVLAMLVAGLGLRRARHTRAPVPHADHEILPDAGVEVLVTGTAAGIFALLAAVVIAQM